MQIQMSLSKRKMVKIWQNFKKFRSRAYNDNVKKFATGGSGVYHDNNETLSQNAIHFERGQNTGDYSTIFGVTNIPMVVIAVKAMVFGQEYTQKVAW